MSDLDNMLLQTIAFVVKPGKVLISAICMRLWMRAWQSTIRGEKNCRKSMRNSFKSEKIKNKEQQDESKLNDLGMLL